MILRLQRLAGRLGKYSSWRHFRSGFGGDSLVDIGQFSTRHTASMPFPFIDIGANLTDTMYSGIYHGKQKHEKDLQIVINRAIAAGVKRIIITGTSLSDSRDALELARTNDALYCTVGCHPTRTKEFEADPDTYYDHLKALIAEGKGKVVAVGECGLDYERLQFSPKETQLRYFVKQLSLAEETKLPMFLHLRNADEDFINIMREHRTRFTNGVVHSFDGPLETAESLLNMELFIGLNGCSLRTKENLEVVKHLPIKRLMIETDAPWCGIKNTHAGKEFIKTMRDEKKKDKYENGKLVKGRNEPCNIDQVLEVIAGARASERSEDIARQCYENTMKVFFNPEASQLDDATNPQENYGAPDNTVNLNGTKVKAEWV